MANLTAPMDIQYSIPFMASYPVAASTVIYAGSALAINASGYVAPITAVAGALFCGIALESANNSAGANGAISVKVLRAPGVIVARNAAGLTQANVGATVYAEDDNNVTVTSGANTAIGTIVSIDSATVARVAIKPTA